MYTGGREEGHMNKTIKYHNELARKIIAKYPRSNTFWF